MSACDDLEVTTASDTDISETARIITDEQKYIEMIGMLYDLLKDAIQKFDLENVIKYSKQMQLVYRRIYTFESLKKAGLDFVNNYHTIKERKNYGQNIKILKQVAENTHIINKMRSILEAIGDSIVEKQMIIQQELMKQINYRKATQLINTIMSQKLADAEAETEQARNEVYTDLFDLIKSKVGMLRGEVAKLNEEREFFMKELGQSEEPSEEHQE